MELEIISMIFYHLVHLHSAKVLICIVYFIPIQTLRYIKSRLIGELFLNHTGSISSNRGPQILQSISKTISLSKIEFLDVFLVLSGKLKIAGPKKILQKYVGEQQKMF